MNVYRRYIFPKLLDLAMSSRAYTSMPSTCRSMTTVTIRS